jgi:predicted negative regulator of RcsB-dependent stress response
VEDLSEKEQLEIMRTWWQENGRYVIGGIVLGTALLLS